jgi:pSer/pThr/pTyr-binding forkhead associated (FHA) protein
MATDDSADRAAQRGPKRWLEWDRRRIALTEGSHVVGRDKDAGIRLNASTVSRRHARLVISRSEVRLEDMGSKNGTFHNDSRVAGTVVVTDGDTLGFGDVRLTFRAAGPDASDETRAVPLR